MRFGVFAHSLLVLALLMLGGCLATPELPLLSDVELAEDAPESGLVADNVDAPETVLQELKSVENLPVVPAVDAAPEKPRRGLAALFGRRNKPMVDATPSAVEGDTIAEVDEDTSNGDVDVTAVEAPRRGLRALFGKRNRDRNPALEQATDVAEASDEAPAEVVENVVVAAIDPEKPARPHRERNGLFGPRRTKTSQFPQVDPSILLPFGQIGLACGVRGKALGKEVDRFPERGKGYRLYDTKPSTTGPRTHYITGFKDGCPRQFTASLALLESPVLHEQLLSVDSIQAQHSTAADKAFQRIRAQICHIGRGKACPEKRIDEMEKSMAFVTTYERFGGSANWNEILLHNGAIAANSAQSQ